MGAVVEKFLFPIFYWAWHIVHWNLFCLFQIPTKRQQIVDIAANLIS